MRPSLDEDFTSSTDQATALDEARALARRARAALCDDEAEVTLLVDRLGDVDVIPTEVGLHDHDGRPTLVCSSDAPLVRAAAAGRTAILLVEPPSSSVRVVIGGRLADLGGESADMRIVTLEPAMVVVEDDADDADDGSTSGRRVPLDLYRAAEPDYLLLTAERLGRHVNAAHGDRLRAFVEEAADVVRGGVLAARLESVSADGVVLDWIGADGSHRLALPFPAAAASPAALAEQLRGLLGACV